MRRSTVRIALIAALLVCTWAMPAEQGYVAVTAWSVLCGAAFAVGSTLLLRSSLSLIALIVFAVTAVLPAVVLLIVAVPVYGNWVKSVAAFAASTATLLPIRGLEFALPTLSAIVAAFLTGCMARDRKR